MTNLSIKNKTLVSELTYDIGVSNFINWKIEDNKLYLEFEDIYEDIKYTFILVGFQGDPVIKLNKMYSELNEFEIEDLKNGTFNIKFRHHNSLEKINSATEFIALDCILENFIPINMR